MRAPVPARLLLAALACLALAACGGGSGGDDPAAAPATTAAATAAQSKACADAAALKASMNDLDQLDPPEAGKAGVLAVVTNVRSNLANLKASAAGQWGAQVTEMDSAVNAFQATVSGVDGDSLLASLPTVIKDLERIDAAWTSLEGQIDRDCG
jgi:hypothetical protein